MARGTTASDTLVFDSAHVAIIARLVTYCHIKAAFHTAAIVRAWVVVIADHRHAHALAIAAYITGGANVLVVARQGVCLKDAANGRVTIVGGAGVLVVASGLCLACAGAVLASVVQGAGVVVIAIVGIWDKAATKSRVTGVCGAGVVVIAHDDLPPATRPVGALVADGAQVVVAAGAVVRGVNACPHLVAVVIGAWVRVITVYGPHTPADTVNAPVKEGATVAVTARGQVLYRLVYAPNAWLARVHGTGVVVIATARISSTFSGDAPVVKRAQVVIIAGRRHFHVLAPHCPVAVVKGAVVVVVARSRCALAGPACARIFDGAGVIVVAGLAVWRVLAPCHRVARVVSARVQVVARHKGPALASGVAAMVSQCAEVVVVAGGLVRCVKAAEDRVTPVVSARVVVVACL